MKAQRNKLRFLAKRIKIKYIKLYRYIKNTYRVFNNKISTYKKDLDNQIETFKDKQVLNKRKLNNIKEVNSIIRTIKSLNISPYEDKNFNVLLFSPYYKDIETYTYMLMEFTSKNINKDSLRDNTTRVFKRETNIYNFTRASNGMKFKDSKDKFNLFLNESEKFLNLYLKLEYGKTSSDEKYYLRMVQPIYFNLITIFKTIIEIKE